MHPFMNRKCCMSVLGRVYRFVADMNDKRFVRLPADVLDELRAALFCLPEAFTDVRAPIQTRIWCSDATPESAGTVHAEVSRAFSRALFDHSEHAGEYTRLDWSEVSRLLSPWEGPVLPDRLRLALKAANWHVGHSLRFRETSHVNLQEARALRLVIRRCAAESNAGFRIIVIVDSRVVLGAFSKGRSSSSRLNSILRSCLGYFLLAGISVHLCWVVVGEC